MNGQRCRLCTANDRQTLIDSVAEDLWESRRHGFDGRPFADCGPYWQRIFREYAETAIDSLQH